MLGIESRFVHGPHMHSTLTTLGNRLNMKDPINIKKFQTWWPDVESIYVD